VMFVGEENLSVSAWPYTQKRLTEAEHINELYPRDENLTVNIDKKQMGIGGSGCGSLPHENYMIDPGKLTYKFLIRYYKTEKGPIHKFARNIQKWD